MVRFFYRIGLTFVVLPAVCSLMYTFLFTILTVMAVHQLPGWAQGPAISWILKETGESQTEVGFRPEPVEIPESGYQGTKSFQCLLPPEIGYLTDPYGVVRTGGWKHQGIDYGSYRQEVEVRTPFGGQVVYAGWYGSLGNVVVIENAGQRVYLAHLSAIELAPGNIVRAGDSIGFSGNTGNSSGIHVHFEVRIWKGDRWLPVDPNTVELHGQKMYCDWYALMKAP